MEILIIIRTRKIFNGSGGSLKKFAFISEAYIEGFPSVVLARKTSATFTVGSDLKKDTLKEAREALERRTLNKATTRWRNILKTYEDS